MGLPFSTTRDEVTVLIDGKRWKHFTELEIELCLDDFSSIELTAPFDASRAELRETFRPFTFKPLQVLVNDEPLFTGRMVGVHPEVSATGRIVRVTGYSNAGVLGDCCAPASSLPLQWKKIQLRSIIEALIAPYGVELDFRAESLAPFTSAKINTDQKIQEFIADLCRQRNLIISDTEAGKLLVWRSESTGAPVARFEEGVVPVTTVNADFSPQEYMSQMTGFGPSRRGRKGGNWTERNPWLPGVLRALNFSIEKSEKEDAPVVTKAKMGRMFGNMATYAIEDLPTWRDPDGALWAKNKGILLKAPNAMIYQETELLIRKVNLKKTATAQTASLSMVLPGSFSGDVPTVLPWGE